MMFSVKVGAKLLKGSYNALQQLLQPNNMNEDDNKNEEEEMEVEEEVNVKEKKPRGRPPKSAAKPAKASASPAKKAAASKSRAAAAKKVAKEGGDLVGTRIKKKFRGTFYFGKVTSTANLPAPMVTP